MGKVLQNSFMHKRDILDVLYFALSNIYYLLTLVTLPCTNYVGNYSYYTLKREQ